MNPYDVIIIGGGITGCAAAYECSKYNFKTLLLEKENDIACGSTKANSAIIHSGYDPKAGTLMAKHNVRGNRLACALAKDLDVPFRETGSVTVAFNEEDERHLRGLYQNGIKNGVELEMLSGEAARKFQPNLSANVTAALYAPTAAVISPWEYAAALIETAVVNGAEFQRNREVIRIQKKDGLFDVVTPKARFAAKYVINAAGVYADRINEMAGGSGFCIQPVRGEYFLFDKTLGSLVTTVVFQCPTKAGKGVVVGPTVHGNLFAGPDSDSALSKEDTATHEKDLDYVRKTALKSVPSIDFSQNIRNFAGLRASAGKDFIIGESEQVPGFINAAGIQSPGLTSAPAIAEQLVSILADCGLALEEKKNFISKRNVVRIAELSLDERKKLIEKNPAYGAVVCRCATITEGEIEDLLKRPVPPVTLDGVKRRCAAGMGRCQGGFCEPRIHAILSRELNVPFEAIMQDTGNSYITIGRTKEDDL